MLSTVRNTLKVQHSAWEDFSWIFLYAWDNWTETNWNFLAIFQQGGVDPPNRRRLIVVCHSRLSTQLATWLNEISFLSSSFPFFRLLDITRRESHERLGNFLTKKADERYKNLFECESFAIVKCHENNWEIPTRKNIFLG